MSKRVKNWPPAPQVPAAWPPTPTSQQKTPGILTKYFCQDCEETWDKTLGKRCPSCGKPAEPLTPLEIQAEKEAKAIEPGTKKAV